MYTPVVNCNDTWLQNYSSLHAMMMVCFLGQNIYWSGKNVSYQELITNCSLAILLAVLLQTPSPHWFGIALSPLPPWSHVSQAMRIGEGRRKEEYLVVSQKN